GGHFFLRHGRQPRAPPEPRARGAEAERAPLPGLEAKAQVEAAGRRSELKANQLAQGEKGGASGQKIDPLLPGERPDLDGDPRFVIPDLPSQDGVTAERAVLSALADA